LTDHHTHLIVDHFAQLSGIDPLAVRARADIHHDNNEFCVALFSKGVDQPDFYLRIDNTNL
jgi:hypothetical protein